MLRQLQSAIGSVPRHFSKKSVFAGRDAVVSMSTEFVNGFIKHDLMTLAAALAFYTAFSLAPLLLLILTVLALMGPHAEANFLNEIAMVIGQDAAEAVRIVVKSASSRPSIGNFAGIVSLLTLLFTASGVFAQMQASLNLIWDANVKSTASGWRSYLKKRIFSMGMVVALAFLALVSLVVSTALAAVLPNGGAGWQFVNNSVSILVFAGLFGTLFKYLPDVAISWHHVLFGGFFTSVLFTIGKWVIGIYLGKSAIGSAYGAAGSLIVLLAWVYYSSIIVFMGAEFTRVVYSSEIKRGAALNVHTSGMVPNPEAEDCTAADDSPAVSVKLPAFSGASGAKI